MTVNKYTNITVSLIALCLILSIVIYRCFGEKKYSQQQWDAAESQRLADSIAYSDTLEVVRGELSLWQERADAVTDRAIELEKEIDSITAKHELSKKKVVPFDVRNLSFSDDNGYFIAPGDYVKDCDGCFDLIGKYKKENVQLRFERDGYDSLMRQQNTISEKRISDLDFENIKLRIKLSQQQPASLKCDTTRKIKFSLMGMFSDPFLPKGGGFGLIYEDKRFNEFAGHVVFTGRGNVYMLNIAKTISFRNKKR